MTVRLTIHRLAIACAVVATLMPALVHGQAVDNSVASSPTLRVVTSDPAFALVPSTDAGASADELSGPRRTSSVAGVRLQSTADAPRPPVLAPSHTGRGQTLAIVGGAAFLGGLMIGGDSGTVIAIGGLAVGVYGLWEWLK